MTDEEKAYLNGAGVLIVPWRIAMPGELTVDGADPAMAGKIINLQTPAELAALPAGTPVFSIFGERKTAGIDEIDTDTRFGRTAWGLLPND